MCRSSKSSLIAAAFIFSVIAAAEGHVYLMEPVSRNFYYTTAFQGADFEDTTYCPHCYQSRGPAAVRDRGTKNTPADVLSAYGGGAWPLKSVYDRGELASNGNYLEPEKIAVRHGICGDPEQTAAEGTNTFGQANNVYPVLETYKAGSIVELKVVVSTYHWGHLEFFICDSQDLPGTGEDGPVTQGCFNMHPLTRAKDDGGASPIDPKHPGRYHLDPPCREAETDQTKADGAFAGYVVTGRYQLPEKLTCERCILQMVYYTGNSCQHPGYADFKPASVPAGCVPSKSDWVTLDPPMCGKGLAYPEEFWNCADISITSDGGRLSPSPSPKATGAPVADPENRPPVVDSNDNNDAGDNDNVTDGDCVDPVEGWGQCGGINWAGSTCCSPGYECKARSDNYWQCGLVDDDCSSVYEQCGGNDWTGPTCCSPGVDCSKQNDWYSQCTVGTP